MPEIFGKSICISTTLLVYRTVRRAAAQKKQPDAYQWDVVHEVDGKKAIVYNDWVKRDSDSLVCLVATKPYNINVIARTSFYVNIEDASTNGSVAARGEIGIVSYTPWLGHGNTCRNDIAARTRPLQNEA
jgi:hypothetical protein